MTRDEMVERWERRIWETSAMPKYAKWVLICLTMDARRDRTIGIDPPTLLRHTGFRTWHTVRKHLDVLLRDGYLTATDVPGIVRLDLTKLVRSTPVGGSYPCLRHGVRDSCDDPDPADPRTQDRPA